MKMLIIFFVVVLVLPLMGCKKGMEENRMTEGEKIDGPKLVRTERVVPSWESGLSKEGLKELKNNRYMIRNELRHHRIFYKNATEAAIQVISKVANRMQAFDFATEPFFEEAAEELGLYRAYGALVYKIVEQSSDQT